jgi:hypothetical protein
MHFPEQAMEMTEPGFDCWRILKMQQAGYVDSSGHSKDRGSPYLQGWRPHVMIITPHNEDLEKFNRDGSTGQVYVSHLAGHSDLYLIMPFKDLQQ